MQSYERQHCNHPSAAGPGARSDQGVGEMPAELWLKDGGENVQGHVWGYDKQTSCHWRRSPTVIIYSYQSSVFTFSILPDLSDYRFI